MADIELWLAGTSNTFADERQWRVGKHLFTNESVFELRDLPLGKRLDLWRGGLWPTGAG